MTVHGGGACGKCGFLYVEKVYFGSYTVHFFMCSREANKCINLIQDFIPLIIFFYKFRHHLCHLQGSYMCLT
jgi:hypothetical protein